MQKIQISSFAHYASLQAREVVSRSLFACLRISHMSSIGQNATGQIVQMLPFVQNVSQHSGQNGTFDEFSVQQGHFAKLGTQFAWTHFIFIYTRTIKLMTTRNHISDFAIQRMNNVSHDQFVAQLLERAQTDEHLLHFCGDEVEALAAAASHEGRAIRKGRKSIYTKQIMKADRNRVRLYNTFKHYVHTFAQMNQENTADAAAHLQLHIDAIGIDPTYQLDRKSGLFIVFLHGLETDLAPYVEILHLEFLVQCIKEANDALRTVTEQRDNERVKRGKAAMRKARQATDDAYCKLVQAISYFTVTKGKAELLNFVAYLNHHIRHYRRYAFGKHQQTQTEKTEQREIDSRDQILAVQAGTIQGEETPPETKLSDSAR